MDAVFEFLEGEGAIIEGAGEAEAVIDEGFLAAAVAVVHAADLRDGLVGFVDEEKGIGGEVVEEGGRGFAGEAAGEVAGIVFDAVAIADGAHHFQVKEGALLESLGFDGFILFFELGMPPFEFEFDGFDGGLPGFGAHDVV